MRWVEGSIVSYAKHVARGDVRISLGNIIGRIEKATTSYGVKPEDVLAIIDNIINNPDILPWIPRERKEEILKPLREAVTMYMRG